MARSGKPRPRKRRPRPLNPPPTWSARRYVQVAPENIALFRFLLEGHDNLALFTVVDRTKGVLLLRSSPDQQAQLGVFLDSLSEHMALTPLLNAAA